MAADREKESRIIQITEGQVSKGGQNPPNNSTERPPAPQGSARKSAINQDRSAKK